jgi:outer membrane protein assembly factor BamB
MNSLSFYRFASIAFVGAILAAIDAQAVSAADRVVLVAGGGNEADGAPAVKAKLDTPFGVEFDRAGNLFLVELTGQRVRKVDTRGVLTTIAGDGQKGIRGDRGPARAAQFNGMHNLAIGADDTIYVADTWNNCVRAIDPKTGMIRRIAGTGDKGYSGDGGAATEAKFGGIYCASLTPDGDKLLLADLDNRRIRAVDLKTGRVSIIAGNGEKGVPKDAEPATDQPLVDPRAVAADKQGNVWVLERSGHALRVVDPQGRIRTVVGTGKAGSEGDGGGALQASLRGPKHLCIDHDGTVLIADTDNHVIRRYLPGEGKIVRVAGSGRKGAGGIGGPPLEAEFNQPHGVYVHRDGTLYITDSLNHRILKIAKTER